MPKLAVIDDEAAILHAFRRAFEDSEIDVVTAGSAREGLEVATASDVDVVIVDVGLPDMSGLDFFRMFLQSGSRAPVIFITGHGSTETAIEAVQLGAYDYLFKPLELDDVRKLVRQAVQISRSMRVPAVVAEAGSDDAHSDALVGRCHAMKDVYRAIGRVAAQDVTVLVLGESGTGKELVSRAIFQHSTRADKPFLAVNCAAIPETLLESELFGHEKGAFTGADHQRIGKIEQCAGGTLFLDEIGDMTPLTQSKILRFLQEREFERVGGNRTIKADVRVIAATNRDLKQMVADGRFRTDLFYRLSVFTIFLPPLRERGDDIQLLAEHYLKRFARELRRNVQRIADESLEHFMAYSWPGNVREFESVLKQSLLQSTGDVLLPDFLPGELTAAPSIPHATHSEFSLETYLLQVLKSEPENLYQTVIDEVDRQVLEVVMRHCDGNLSHAARILGITRVTLRNKLKLLNDEPDQS